tara:strand:+ start:2078 stop:2548 length:471 start_codon:yes stop_codon:yes gene_type:complete
MKKFLKSFFILLNTFTNVNTLTNVNTFTNVNTHIFYPFEEKINDISHLMSKYDTHNNLNLEEMPLIISKTDINLQKEIGKKIVTDLSSVIPKLDIGYDVLHANNKFIVKVLSLDEHYVPHEIKKDIILLSIKLAQNADELGSYLFQQYYNLVDSVI